MAIESFSGIWSLNTSNPLATDDVGTTDDHLRGIKLSIRQTFPEVSATVNVSHSELNHLSGVSTNIQNAMDAISTSLQAEISRTNTLSASLAAEITRTNTLSASLAAEISRVDTLSASLAHVIAAAEVAYAGLSITAGAAVIFSASASPSAYNVWTTGSPVANFTVTTASGSMVPSVDGVYYCSVNFSFSGDASTQYTAAIYRDNVATNLGAQRFLGTGADMGSMGFAGVLSSAAGQEFKVRINASGADVDFVSQYAAFTMIRIPSG